MLPLIRVFRRVASESGKSPRSYSAGLSGRDQKIDDHEPGVSGGAKDQRLHGYANEPVLGKRNPVALCDGVPWDGRIAVGEAGVRSGGRGCYNGDYRWHAD